MKNRRNLLGGLLAVVAVSMSSCTRGIGCPSDFSLNIDITEVVTQVIAILPF